MIRSMTGFAAASREDAAGRVDVTVKSVNHRFLDVVVKAPPTLAPVEPRVKAVAQARLARGRVDVSIAVEPAARPAREVALDEALLARVAAAFEGARERGLVAGALSPGDALRIPGVLDVAPRADAGAGVAPDLAALVELAVADAVAALVAMRETEGRFLAADLDGRLATLAGFVETLADEARAGQAALDARLRERLAALPADLSADPALVAQEVVRVVARSDIDEEVVRLRGHLGHWRALAGGPEPCGRKLDFLVQELLREVNTIGSKAEGGRVVEVVIAAKAEIERMREQVQNVE